MMLKPNSLRTTLNNVIENISNDKGVIDLFSVVSYDEETFTCVIKRLNTQVYYEDVPLMVQGVNNDEGLVSVPSDGSIVICAFLTNEPTPIILGGLYNKFFQNPEKNVTAKQGETISKKGSSIIKQEQNGTVTISNDDGFLRLNTDGTITMNAFTFPKNDGNAGQVLKTNGSGVLNWADDIVGGS